MYLVMILFVLDASLHIFTVWKKEYANWPF